MFVVPSIHLLDPRRVPRRIYRPCGSPPPDLLCHSSRGQARSDHHFANLNWKEFADLSDPLPIPAVGKKDECLGKKHINWDGGPHCNGHCTILLAVGIFCYSLPQEMMEKEMTSNYRGKDKPDFSLLVIIYKCKIEIPRNYCRWVELSVFMCLCCGYYLLLRLMSA